MPHRVIASVLSAFPAATFAQATFELLPPLPGVEHTYATHISADAKVIAGHTRTSTTPFHSVFRWTEAGGYQTHSHTASYSFFPVLADITPDGSALCGMWFSFSDYALFRWSSGFEPQVITHYSYDPRSIRLSPDASLIIGGVYLDPVRSDTFIHDGLGTSYPLRPPAPLYPYNRRVHTVSRDLSTGYGYSGEGEGAFRWDIASNALVTLQPTFASFGACSHDGATVAGSIGSGPLMRGAVWRHRGASGPHLLHPDWHVDVDAMSADGSRILGAFRQNESSPWQAFIWEPALGIAELSTYLARAGAQLPPTWHFEISGYDQRLAISADGLTIVGSGRAAPAAPVQGWRATLPPVCYANCDASTSAPTLNIADFTCFLTRFTAGDIYANCDDSSEPPYLTAADFTCFLTRFAAGCP